MLRSGRALYDTRTGKLSKDGQGRFAMMRLVVDPERNDVVTNNLIMCLRDTIPTNIRKKS